MNPVEEKLYQIAGAEIAAKNVSLGLWAKAFSTALGDEAKTKAFYIQFRVSQLREKFAAELNQQNETAAQRHLREDEAIRRSLESLRGLPFEDADYIPADRFDGYPESLRVAVSTSRASAVADVLEFQIIDVIKRGHLRGVRHAGDWYFDLQPFA